MENITRIAAIAISAALCAVVIKKQVPEIALVLSIVAGAIILFFTLPAIERVKEYIDTLSQTVGMSSVILSPVIKTVGISIITKVTAEICRDAKESALASFVEIAGAGGAILVCLPLVEIVLDMIVGLL